MGALDEAEAEHDAIRQSLEKTGGDAAQRHLATAYHQLGMVSQDRGDLSGAETWYRKSLEINESLGNLPVMAQTYHELGRVSQHRGNLIGAETWYRKSLEIKESLGDRPGMAFTYGQLGLLAEARESFVEALDWMVRCVALFSDFPHPATGPGPYHLARFTASLGMGALEESWRRCTREPLPAAVRAWVEAQGGGE